jgi:hypothetical protein
MTPGIRAPGDAAPTLPAISLQIQSWLLTECAKKHSLQPVAIRDNHWSPVSPAGTSLTCRWRRGDEIWTVHDAVPPTGAGIV